MKFDFKISEIANKFFFISNLSEWHFSCRKDYNQEWLRLTGPLTDKEQKALILFKKILNKYNFTYKNNQDYKIGKSKFLGKFFYIFPEKRVWQKIKEYITIDEFKQVSEIFSLFCPRFEKIWNSHSRYDTRVKIFQKAVKQKNFRAFFENLETFFDSTIDIMNVIILFSPLDHNATASGNANIDNNHIVLELAALKKQTWQLDHAVGILAHEIGHILYRASRCYDVAEKIMHNMHLPYAVSPYLKPQRNTLEMLNELTISSLMPSGYLSQKYYTFKPLDIHFSDANLKRIGQAHYDFLKHKYVSFYAICKYLTWQLYPLVSFYINSGRKIDRDFIKIIIKTSLFLYK